MEIRPLRLEAAEVGVMEAVGGWRRVTEELWAEVVTVDSPYKTRPITE